MSSIILKTILPSRAARPKPGHITLFIDKNDGKVKGKLPDNSITTIANSTMSNPLFIPTPEVKITNLREVSTDPLDSYDRLHIRWSSPSLEFLDHNPQVWVFRPTVTRKKITKNIGGTATDFKLIRKKYSHPSNNNGVDYPNGGANSGRHTFLPKQGGGTILPIRTTEFSIPSTANTWQQLAIDPLQWFFKRYIDGGGDFLDEYDFLTTGDLSNLSDTLPYNEDYKVYCSGSKDRFKFLLAIVIDDPNVSGAKIIGPMSRGLTIRFNRQSRRFTYTDNKDF
jgi:hypothetical protein